MRMLSVDPGVTGTGYAIWSDGNLSHWGTFYPNLPKAGWLQKALSIKVKFSDLLSPDITRLIIEYPVFMRGTGGYMVASAGDLCKLAVLTGMILGQFPHRRIVLVEPSQWKGQLPKSVCRSRIENILGVTFSDTSNHAIDAIGIGLWSMGRF